MPLFVLVLITLLIGASCKAARQEGSEVDTSREARAVLGGAVDVSPSVVHALDEDALRLDWQAQQRAAISLWSDLNESVVRPRATFNKWETWYSKEDLTRVFRIAYEGLGVEGRKARRAFSESEVAKAIEKHDIGQFSEPSWNTALFERWFEKYSAPEKHAAIPGLNKVLMNRTAVEAILHHYSALDSCLRRLSEGLPCSQMFLTLPKGAAFLKLAWRRGQSDLSFEVPYFQTQNLSEQYFSDEWQVSAKGIPSGANARRLETPTGQIFFLTGVHLSYRLESNWFWTSHWIDEDQSLKTCSTLGFEPLAREDRSPFEAEVAKIEAIAQASWCSNPYLETGVGNQKTSCTGCHQHAGVPWTEEDFRARLESDVKVLQTQAGVRSRSDQVWSLLNGPEPLASFIMQEIDYFDVYDL